MRARISLSLLLSCSLIVLLAPFSPAQIHGTPSSVTSFGFGGNFNPAPGVPASVTSLGPNGFGNGFDCCFRPGFSNHPRPFRDHQLRDHERFPIGLSVPVFVPYAVPYPVYAEAETGDDDSVDADSTYRRGVPRSMTAATGMLPSLVMRPTMPLPRPPLLKMLPNRPSRS